MTGLREAKKARTLDALERAAWRLFEEAGYDATTIPRIAEVAGVSPRTFFRYFESKEAVLFGRWRESLVSLRESVAAQPASTSVGQILRHLAHGWATTHVTDRDRSLARQQLASSSGPVLRYERETIYPALESAVSGALAERLAVSPLRDPRPVLAAGVFSAVLRASKTLWLAPDGEGRPLEAIVEQMWETHASLQR